MSGPTNPVHDATGQLLGDDPFVSRETSQSLWPSIQSMCPAFSFNVWKQASFKASLNSLSELVNQSNCAVLSDETNDTDDKIKQ